MVDHYPDSLKNIGVGGTANVWVYIDEHGAVRDTRLAKTSGIEALDQAALAAAAGFAFTPALNHDKPVAVWLQIPIAFSTSSGGPAEAARFELRSILRMIATIQEHQYQETGEYYKSLDEILESIAEARQQGMNVITPAEDEVVLFDVRPNGWAAVVKKDDLECAMYYGKIAAPTDYAEPGKAVCK